MENTVYNSGDSNYKKHAYNNEYYVDKTNMIVELNEIINS